MRRIMISSALLAIAATGCKTTQPEAPEIVINAPPIQTCAPVSSLQKVVIPAETKIRYAITMIDNPPYEPIERKEKQVVVVKPAQIIYVDSEGKEVLDICEDVERGATGPGVGEMIPDGEG